jgi:serine/threonine protein kinase
MQASPDATREPVEVMPRVTVMPRSRRIADLHEPDDDDDDDDEVPARVEAAPQREVEYWEDVTGELSRLIAPADPKPRPRRNTTEPPPIPRRASITSMSIPPLPRAEHVGDWRLERTLGRGGMGEVIAVEHREFGKRAALKISHATLSAGGLGAAVFLREARVVQLVEHPAVPDVFATGTHEDRPYLVMERLAGETVQQRLERGPIDRREALDILDDLCDVLDAAHRAGVVHRDLKPENVFVLDRPTGPRIKLLDWGFARLTGEDDPLVGMIAGTLGYVAPEQVFGHAVTPASDIYSLGVLAYRLLLGQSPFSGTSAVDLVRHHVNDPPPDPALLWPAIPPVLGQLLVAMLAKEPSWRPSLTEVRAALRIAREPRRRRFTFGQPPLASPMVQPSLGQRAFRAAFAIACVLAGALAAVGACR